MTDVTMPNILEFIKTKTLDKGRVSTTIIMFLLDKENYDDMAARYIRGEITSLEARIGSSMKHPKDKYDKKIAKAEAAKRFKKEKMLIT